MTDVLKIKKGYVWFLNNKMVFLETNAARKSVSMIKAFCYGYYNQGGKINISILDRCLNDNGFIKDMYNHLESCTLTYNRSVYGGNVSYWYCIDTEYSHCTFEVKDVRSTLFIL